MEFTGNLPGPTLAGATRGGRSGPRLATRGQSSPAVRNKWKIEENTGGGGKTCCPMSKFSWSQRPWLAAEKRGMIKDVGVAQQATRGVRILQKSEKIIGGVVRGAGV
jgi:hypothetical protein